MNKHSPIFGGFKIIAHWGSCIKNAGDLLQIADEKLRYCIPMYFEPRQLADLRLIKESTIKIETKRSQKTKTS